jgi:HK97 family phage portal protein
MGFIEKELRSSLENPQTPLRFPAEWLLDMYNGGRTDSGIRVSQLTALQIGTVRTCVQLIGGTIGSLPFHIYESKPSTNGHRARTIAYDHPMYDMIHLKPNSEMVHKTFIQTLLAHCLLWANGYAEIQRDKAGNPIALWPRNPGKTRPYRLLKPLQIGGDMCPQGEMVYVTTDGLSDYDQSDKDAMGLSRSERILLKEDMIHIPGLSLDGRIGLDVVEYARQTFGLALAMEKYAGKFFGNGGRTSMIIKVPGNVSKEQRDKIRQSYQEALGGENMLRPIVLTQGVDIEPISIKQNEAQFIESKQMEKEEICALFHVPPHMVGLLERTARANAEQFAQEFWQFCLLPWCEGINQEFKVKLLPENTLGRPGKKYVFDFDADRIIRGDSDARQKYAASMFAIGAFSPNDIREYEGKNPIDNPAADKTYVPVNMMELGGAPPEPNAPGTNPANPKDPGTSKPPIGKDSLTMDFGTGGSAHMRPDTLPNLPDVLQQRYSTVYSPLFRDAFTRLLAKKKIDSAALYRHFAPVLTAISADLASEVSLQLRVEKPLEDLFGTFIKDYVGSMAKRASDWTEESAKPELDRAIKAIGIAAFEAIGGHKGKATFRSIEFREALTTDPVAYIVEHADTDYVDAGKMHGEDDISLNARGQVQAQAAADWLKANVPVVRFVVSSDLKRALETAAPIAEAFGVNVVSDRSLRPLKIGDLSGQPDEKLMPYIKDPALAIPNGETVNNYIARSPVFDYLGGGDPNHPTVLVLHSLSIAATIDKAETGDPLKNLLQIKKQVKSGGILAVRRDPADKSRYSIDVAFEGK